MIETGNCRSNCVHHEWCILKDYRLRNLLWQIAIREIEMIDGQNAVECISYTFNGGVFMAYTDTPMNSGQIPYNYGPKIHMTIANWPQ